MGPPSAAGTIPDDARAVLSYDGKLSELFGIFLVNLALTIVTFGLFHFWAITRLRRYLWSHMRIEGTPFLYTGKGKELFQGFLLAILTLVLLFSSAAVAAELLKKSYRAQAPLPYITAAVGLLVLIGATRFAALRYRLNHTEWCGISGGMDGTALRYGANWVVCLLACVVTVAQALPWLQVSLARCRIDAIHFGSAIFHCEGRGRQLYLSWLATIFSHIVLIGVITAIVAGFEGPWLAHVFFGRAKVPIPHLVEFRVVPAVIGGLAIVIGSAILVTSYRAKFCFLIVGKTSALVRGRFRSETLRFGMAVDVDGLAWLTFTNLVMVILTLGLGAPVVLHRNAHFMARAITVTGTFDANTLALGTLAPPTPATGLLQSLDPEIV
jgi:uncharacterized membrane protein YjgN (DUF898 family)